MRRGVPRGGWWILVLALAAARGASAASAPGDSVDGWSFSIVPYLWAPQIDGTLDFATQSGQDQEFVVSVEPISYLEHLSVPVMIAASVQHGGWTAATDVVYVRFSGQSSTVETVSGPGGRLEVPIDAGSEVGLEGTIVSLVGGRTLVHDRQARLEVLGGVRYFALRCSLDWRFEAGTAGVPRSGAISETEDLWDGIVAARGEVRFGGGRWLAPFYLDAGSGTSTWTLNTMAGLGYAFGHGDVRLLYRFMQFDGGEGKLLRELRLSGPAVGLNLRF